MNINIESYNKGIKLKYRKYAQSLFEIGSDKFGIRKWMNKYIPIGKLEHKEKRDKAQELFKKLDKEYWELVNTAFKKQFGQPYHIWDYKVSGIIRDEFPDEVKIKLRALIKEMNSYENIAYAHNIMLPAALKNEINLKEL